MNSRLYSGWVSHERKAPKVNRFRYQLYYLLVDLDELDDLDASLRRFSHNGFNVAALRDRDHGARDGSPLKPWIEQICADAGIDIAGGRVELLTFPRVLGFGFYPVAFWYCYSSDGVCVAVLAEVRNTFGEHHDYLIHDGGQPLRWNVQYGKDKVFHVSPFLPTEGGRYLFRFSEPREKLRLSIHDHIEGPLMLVAAIDMEAKPLTDKELIRTVLRLGPMSARAWTLIHLQAFRIIGKGIRYVPKPSKPSEEIS